VKVLDPFAGTGGIHKLSARQTVGVELEPEWANQHPNTIIGNALNLPFPDASFDAIATSPTYGNRMADHHDAKEGSTRHTYKHTLGRNLTDTNSGAMQWGNTYRQFHRKAWAEAIRVLKPGGRLVLNISDHIRKGQPQGVNLWHVAALCELGLTFHEAVPIETKRQRHGANAHLRVGNEWIITFTKDATP
jgi:tRNA G10  N-methylase Trm11